MVLNFTMIGDNSGKDFDSKPAKTPDGIHRSETWLKTAGCNIIWHDIEEKDGLITKFTVY